MEVESLRGLVLVVDSFAEPCDPFLRHLCTALVARQQRVALASADVPRHRLSWVPDGVHVMDCYVAANPLDVQDGGGALVVHSVTHAVLRNGVVSVLGRLHELLQTHTIVAATVHADCLPARDLDQLKGSCSAIVHASPAALSIVNRKAGGKVTRTHQRVLDWSKGQFMAATAAAAPAVASLRPADDAADRSHVVLPFIKTAVSGKMMFGDGDGDDDGEGDLARGSDSDSDPDADLDV